MLLAQMQQTNKSLDRLCRGLEERRAEAQVTVLQIGDDCLVGQQQLGFIPTGLHAAYVGQQHKTIFRAEVGKLDHG